MGNTTKKLFTALMAVPMALSVAGTAVFAEENVGTSIQIKKTLTMPTGTTKPADEFTFTGTLEKVNGIDPYNDNDADLSATISSVTKTTEEDGTTTYTATTTMATATYTHAGVYEYTVKENVPAEDEKIAGMTYAQNSYRVMVYVKENQTDSNKFDVTAITAQPIDETTTTTKVKPDDNGNLVLGFTNTYEDQTPVTEVKGATVTNTVNGDYGDKSKQFKYELTLNAAEGVTPSVKKGDTSIGPKDGKYSFTLAHGESVAISNVPVGTKYHVVQIDGDEYKTTQGYTADGATPADGEYKPTYENKYFDGYITSKLDELAYTNTREGITPTGNFINNMPFIALIAVALGGFVAYIAAKRRRA